MCRQEEILGAWTLYQVLSKLSKKLIVAYGKNFYFINIKYIFRIKLNLKYWLIQDSTNYTSTNLSLTAYYPSEYNFILIYNFIHQIEFY